MIIHKIDVESFAVLEAENDSPVRSNCNGPETSERAFEGMKPKSGETEIGNFLRCLHQSQDLSDPPDVLWVKSSWVVVLVKLLQSLVLEACDHRASGSICRSKA